MIITDAPNVQYAYRRNLEAENAQALIAELEALDPNAAVGHLSGNLQATRGVWVRIGNYRIVSDSFIDPSDLMLYVASYYAPSGDGSVEALELNHGAEAPDDALRATTLDELLDALAALDCSDEREDEGDGAEEVFAVASSTIPHPEGHADSADSASVAKPHLDDTPPTTPGRLEGMTVIEPAAASEMRGALVKGWHAMFYEAPDGSSLLVFD